NLLEELSKSSLKMLSSGMLKDQDGPNNSRQKITRALKQEQSFKRCLIFDFYLCLELPEPIGCENDKDPPTVERFSLRWPVPLSKDQFNLEILGMISTAFYNPEPEISKQSESRQNGGNGVEQYESSQENLSEDRIGVD